MIEILTDQYKKIDTNLCSKYKSVELDIGCGDGSFTIELAKLYPQKLIIGVDIKLGRLRKVQKKALRNHLTNIFLVRSMAWNVVTYYLPDNFIERLHILCPDPWPKHRHRHNRLLSSQFIGQIGTKIKPNGTFHFSTDDLFYLSEFKKSIGKFNTAYSQNENLINDIAHIKTDFEKLWNSSGKEVHHLTYKVM